MQRTIVDYLSAVVSTGGSDLHLSVGMPPAVRIHGDIIPLEAEILTEEALYDMLLGVLTDSQRARLEEHLELDFALAIDNVGRFRGNAHFIRGAAEATFRHILEDIPNLESLGHEPAVQQLCHMKDGLVLVTGITGSGKSSSLAAMVDYIARTHRKVIISIEDPVEFVFKHSTSLIKQREVGTDTHAFSAALKHALRQDPDVIMVSELRDMETIQAAITAAETGHLVLGTLHTIDAPRTLDRLIDVFPHDQQSQIVAQLANCLRAVISQRLVKAAEPGKRVLAEEIMLVNHSIRNCIRDLKFEQIDGLIEIGRQEGMFTIDYHLCELIKRGKITVEEAYLNSRDTTVIDTYMLEVNKDLAEQERKRKGR